MIQKIYKTIQGKKIELTASQIKAEIKKVQGWNDKEYVKNLSIIQKRIGTLATFEQQSGVDVEKTSAVRFLYFESRAKKIYGKNYQPSAKALKILNTPAYSGKMREKYTKNVNKKSKISKVYESVINYRFSGLINSNETARKIAESIADPVLRERALAKFANQMHESIADYRKKVKGSSVRYGSSFGSDNYSVDLESFIENL